MTIAIRMREVGGPHNDPPSQDPKRSTPSNTIRKIAPKKFLIT